MKDYLAKKGRTGQWINGRPMAENLIQNGFEIYLDGELVASRLEDLDQLDLEPDMPKPFGGMSNG